ncbi:Oxo-4-hydroxy-4-carboxy-5-ureidoimidazoline decarboxylase [Xylariaceae sp. FL0255]|nr:Oxo-4-hydroxy-4-carboxy-5-ureidoimidazoline decarboxylase [Xylariaceae sp. FL0255]
MSSSLPPVASLCTADDETIKQVLDTLFEPAPEIHALALPAIQQKHQRKLANPGLSAPDLPGPPSAATIPDTLPPFTSYGDLIKHIGTLMTQLTITPKSSSQSINPSQKTLHAILGSHPRLGAKKVDSAQSRAEQAQLNNDDKDEAQKLAALNAEYEAKFPGLRYVVFVNGRGRDVIMEDMRRRIDRGDIRAEEREGVQAMVDIALDRAQKLGVES